MDGKEIRENREYLGLTQEELGKLFGKTANTIARWERDEVKFESPLILRLAFEALKRKCGRSKTAKRNALIEAEIFENLAKTGETIERIKKM